jgi:aminoglycoside 6'-N-acetyltransferase
MIFESEHLIARRFGPRDIEAVTAMRSDPEVARYQSWETYSVADATRLLGELRDRNPGDPGWYQFAIALKEGGALVGDCGLRVLETDGRLAQIGYTIARSHWNKGYATEVIGALSSYAFATFGIHRITASVDPRNVASCRALEKAGYRREALFRQSEWFKGDWADDAVYARLRSDAA